MESLPFLLELVRIKKVESYNDDIMILDNYKVSHKLTSSPKYSDVGFIEYDELDKDYKFAKSTYDKYLLVKFLKTIFYEFKPETVNYHNYNMIYQYYNKYDMIMQTFGNIINNEERRLNDVRKMND